MDEDTFEQYETRELPIKSNELKVKPTRRSSSQK
jgi:hypothetical protein